MNKSKVTISIILLLIIIFLSFYPSLKNGFVNWDDDNYVVNNSSISSISASNLKSIFTSFFIGHYQPLTILSYVLNYQFFKLNPLGYHLTNLILHLLNSLLVFYLIYLLSGNIGVSFITAILFGLHPLHVESVAWVSERKDVLYSFFYLLSAITYLYYLTKGYKHKYYLISLFLFLCSLLSKSMAVTLPLLLLLMDYYLKRKPNKGLILDKIPYFVLSIISSAIVIFGLILFGGVRQEPHYGILSTLSIASYGIVFYLGKLFLPIKLSCLYPYYGFAYNSTYLYYSIIAVTLLAILIVLSVKYTRKLLFGAIFFLITLLPILQFIPNSPMIVADRYIYLPSLGIFFIMATFIYWIYNKKLKVLAVILAISVILPLLVVTYNRCMVWKDGVTLWNNALANYSDSAIIYNNLGVAYSDQGEHDEAISNYRKALKIDPYYAESHNNIGVSLSNKNEYDKALVEFNKAVEVNPNYSDPYYNIAKVYKISGNHMEVIRFCKKAIKINPNNTKAYADLCAAYGNTGDFKEAIRVCSKAVKLDPLLGAAHYNLSVAYYFDKQYNLALMQLNAAIKLGWVPDPAFVKEVKGRQITK